MTNAVGDALNGILNEYPDAKLAPMKGHPLARFVTHDMRELIQRFVGDEFQVDSSVGAGNWAGVPWIAIFDPDITSSAQKGYYPVYLFSADGARVYLSLNQARTEVHKEFGGRVEEILLSRAEEARQMLAPFAQEDLLSDILDLGSTASLPAGYSAGNILAFEYERGSIPNDEVLIRDLYRILSLYRAYKGSRTGVVDLTGDDIPEDISSGEEKKKYRWHRRAERNRKLSKDAKKFHGYICQVCKFDFERQYGKLGHEYIEAHHVVPLAELLKELEPVVLDPKTDFVVVCSNCHRMLHRVSPVLHPTDLTDLVNSPWEMRIAAEASVQLETSNTGESLKI